MAKRLFDLFGASLGLVLLAPLLLAVAAAIKLDSRGPVLFRQQRVGRHGATFRIHKFRTMAVDAPRLGPAITVGDDPRVTRAGRWLRRYRFDELPQLVDVLAGDMSLVGPRPEVPEYVAKYPPDLRDAVLALRPGMTDPAAIAILDEGDRLARAADPEREYVQVLLPRKLALSVQYARDATLWTDLHVLWRLGSRLNPAPAAFLQMIDSNIKTF